MSMRPSSDRNTIDIPISFDFKTGQTENMFGKLLVTGCIFFGYLLVAFLILGTSKSFIVKMLIVIGLGLALFFWLRYVTWTEGVYSDAYEGLKETDFKVSTRAFWGIYEISPSYPYFCHLKNGLTGLYVTFKKDVVVGKPPTVLFDHFESIGDAYQVAYNLNIGMKHIDIMDSIGNDSRLAELYSNAEACDNPDIKQFLYDTFDNLAFQMGFDYASYDIYLFTSREDETTFWYKTRDLISYMMTANYVTYQVQNSTMLRDLAKALLNLESFSVTDACNSTFFSDRYAGLSPISIKKSDGEFIKLNDTLEEKRIKREKVLEEEKEKKIKWKEKPIKERILIRLGVFKVLFNLLTKLLKSFKRKKSVDLNLDVSDIMGNSVRNVNVSSKESQASTQTDGTQDTTKLEDIAVSSISEEANKESTNDDDLDIF